MNLVIDSSAVLAILFDEPGGDVAANVSQGATLSAVNAVEVIEKFAERYGSATIDAITLLERLEIMIAPFTIAQASIAAKWKPLLVGKNISLADRACLALARDQGVPALTADRIWATLDIGVDIRLIR